MDGLDISKYLDMALRRKWWIIIPFLLVLLAGLTYALRTPRIYEAKTLILVQPQRVPEDYVRAIVSVSVEQRLRTITQQVTSRTNLEKIIKQYGLYQDKEDMLLDDKVALLREMIKVEVSHRTRRDEANAFTISFRDKDPEKAAAVTNALASNFITENLKMREAQALGTSSFLADELESVKRKLAAKEEELKQYRIKYMGGLPEQLETNLSILERLQTQLDQYHENLRDAENRKILIQQQIADAEKTPAVEMASPGEQGGTQSLAELKAELAMLESRYTERHPDVIRLRETIARLEASQGSMPGESASRAGPPSRQEEGVLHSLRRQLEEVNLEINQLKAEIKETEAEIKVYEKRIEETPKREQELLSLNRDYENLRELYNSLLNRKLEAELAVSLEKKQKGEQFRVIDPAKVPSRPVEPDMRKILLATFILALGLGCGLAYLVEMMDTSYKDPEEVEKDLGLPVLLSIPIRYTKGELRRMKFKTILAYSSVSIGFLASVFGILVATKGLDKTLRFFTELVTRSGGG